ncbi:MAG: glycosyltransferase family 2 protein [Synergistaceae bacterium]|nr:glycosyltransferase family 2 protein [Synergistaceae bacterium]
MSHQQSAISHNNALVSIIIPAYNTAQYIHRAIESSLRQTHKNVEVLVVDDGSTDDTLKIAQEYAARDGRLRVFTQENAGVSAARNHAMREAKGEYMIFLDSDDWLEDDAVEVLLGAQAEHPDKFIAMRYNEVYFVPGRNDVFRIVRPPKDSQPQFIANIKEILSSSVDNFYLAAAATKLFSTEMLRKYDIQFKEGMHHCEDMIFTVEYLRKTSGVFLLGKTLLNVLYRFGSATRTSYSQEKVHQIISTDPVKIMIDSENDPEMKAALMTKHTKVFMRQFNGALCGQADINTLRRIREKVKLYRKDVLASDIVAFKWKAAILCAIYLPLRVNKFLIPFLNRLNQSLKKKKAQSSGREEFIPYW